MTGSDRNLFENLQSGLPDEEVTALLETGHFKLARIVSCGQATPAGEWYDQDRAEGVVLLKGRAGLRFEDEAAERVLAVGDVVHIVPHRRHRISWTAENEPTVWLALYYDDQGKFD